MRNELPPNHIVISLDVRRPVPIEHSLRLADVILRDLRSIRDIGPTAPIELVHLGTGSLRFEARLSAWSTAAAAAIALVALFKSESDSGPIIHQTFHVYEGGTVYVSGGNEEFALHANNIPAIPIAETAEPFFSPPMPKLEEAADISDLKTFSGRVFTGTRGYVLHTDDGQRLEVVEMKGGRYLPTAVPVEALGRETTQIPRETIATGTIAIEDWYEAGEGKKENARKQLRGDVLRTANGFYLRATDGTFYALWDLPPGPHKSPIDISGWLTGHKDPDGNPVLWVNSTAD